MFHQFIQDDLFEDGSEKPRPFIVFLEFLLQYLLHALTLLAAVCGKCSFFIWPPCIIICYQSMLKDSFVLIFIGMFALVWK